MKYTNKIVILGHEEKEFRDKLNKLLTDKFNIELNHFTSSKTLLKNLEELEPDLVISKENINGDSGIHVCRAIKDIEGFQDIYFVLITDERGKPENSDCYEKGVDGIIPQNISSKKLLAEINPFIELINAKKKIKLREERLEKVRKENYKYKKELEYKSKRLLEEGEDLDETLEQVSNMAEKLKEAHERIRKIKKKRKEDFENFVEVVSLMIYSGNKTQRAHAQKVAKISRYIAQKMGLEEQVIDNIETAARLHEIGSYNISKKLKNKDPANYSVSEKLIIKRQPLKGGQLLAKYLGEDSSIVKIIRHYNEHIDGSGFPDNLSGNAIPIGSRIIVAVDYFEESVKRYNHQVEEVINDLEKYTGQKFDHEVVSILKKYVSDRYEVENGEEIKEIKISELEPGMILAEDVYTKSGVKLVPKNTSLDKKKIHTLVKYSKIDPLEDNIYIKRL